MKAEGHRTAAEHIEHGIAKLGDPATDVLICRLLCEAYFGATFLWIAYGMQLGHGQHKESHSNLPSYLNSLGEILIGQRWQQFESIRTGAWYGQQDSLASAQQAQAIWQEIRTWALAKTPPTP
jgi:hypothetical protein